MPWVLSWSNNIKSIVYILISEQIMSNLKKNHEYHSADSIIFSKVNSRSYCSCGGDHVYSHEENYSGYHIGYNSYS